MPISRRTFLTSSATGAAASALTLPVLASARQQATPTSATPVADASDRETRLLTAMEQHGIPGAIVLLDSPETGLWKAALGLANLETNDPMTTDMHMRIGSITKTFTSTKILQLVDQGALAMDDTLATLLPSQAELPNAEAMTLRHLLTMQSGLPDYVTQSMVMEPDPDETVTEEEIIELIADKPADFAPGEQTIYSNTNYILLSMIAQEATGTPWQELVQVGILDQVGLAHTMIPTGPELPTPSPRGYAYPMPMMEQDASATPVSGTPAATPDPNAGPVDMSLINSSIPGAAGNMISTVDDLHAWMNVLMDGTLLSPELQADRMDFSDEAALTGPIGEMAYGLGLTMVYGAIGHDGGITGFRSSMFTWPETGTTLITLANVLPTRDGQDPMAILTEAVLGE